MGKFRYVIFNDGIYQITVDDYDGNPYTFEVSGEEIGQAFRRERLLDKIMSEIDYDNLNLLDLDK